MGKLGFVGCIKAAQLQLYGYQAAQVAMAEEGISIEVPIAYAHALLPGYKGEVCAKHQQEPLQLPEN